MNYFEQAMEILEVAQLDLESERSEAQARSQRRAGIRDGLAADDFEGAAEDAGIIRGLDLAIDRILEARETLAARCRIWDG